MAIIIPAQTSGGLGVLSEALMKIYDEKVEDRRRKEQRDFEKEKMTAQGAIDNKIKIFHDMTKYNNPTGTGNLYPTGTAQEALNNIRQDILSKQGKEAVDFGQKTGMGQEPNSIIATALGGQKGGFGTETIKQDVSHNFDAARGVVDGTNYFEPVTNPLDDELTRAKIRHMDADAWRSRNYFGGGSGKNDDIIDLIKANETIRDHIASKWKDPIDGSWLDGAPQDTIKEYDETLHRIQELNKIATQKYNISKKEKQPIINPQGIDFTKPFGTRDANLLQNIMPNQSNKNQNKTQKKDVLGIR